MEQIYDNKNDYSQDDEQQQDKMDSVGDDHLSLLGCDCFSCATGNSSAGNDQDEENDGDNHEGVECDVDANA